MHRQLTQHLRSSDPKRHPSTPRGTWGNFWESRGGVGKSGVQIDEKLLWSAYRKSSTLFRTVPSTTLYGLSFPKIRFRPHPKLQSLLSHKGVKSRTSYSADTFLQGQSEQKPVKNFRPKGAWVYPGTPQFWVGTPYYLGNE